MAYLKNPQDIESKSMEIIEQGMKAHSFTEMELKVIKRTIHTTGDFDYQHIVSIKPGAIEAGIEAICSGCRIVTDTRMAYSGINKRALEKANCQIDCYIAHEDVFKASKEQGITRSMAAIDLAAKEGVDIFVIGNAPTALYRIGELIEHTRVAPELIIGVPVGLVGARESKEMLLKTTIPFITVRGEKGGSPLAVSIINSLAVLTFGEKI